MYKILALLFVVASASAGVVFPVGRCGGVGTPVQLRISGCEGRCALVAGSRVECEEDFIPSSAAPSLSLRIDVCYVGFCWNILETELAGSSVQPGQMYTARYTIVPNDIFKGEAIDIQAYLYHTDNSLVEVCLTFEVDII